jgi:hypothetical protein
MTESFKKIYKILDNRLFLRESAAVYHYTSLEALYKILKNKSLHLTHLKYLSDFSEFELGCDLFIQSLERHLKEQGMARAGVGDSIIPVIKDSKGKGPTCSVSFSQLKDSLGQWRAYAENAQGVAIGFSVKALENLCSAHDLVFGQTVYSNKYDEIFNRLILEFAKNHREELLIEFLTLTSCFIKHEGFSEEKEVRIVSGRNLELKNKFSNGFYIPYQELKFECDLTDLISEIWVGPAARQELAARSIRLMLKEFNLSQEIIRVSNIPYRILKKHD